MPVSKPFFNRRVNLPKLSLTAAALANTLTITRHFVIAPSFGPATASRHGGAIHEEHAPGQGNRRWEFGRPLRLSIRRYRQQGQPVC